MTFGWCSRQCHRPILRRLQRIDTCLCRRMCNNNWISSGSPKNPIRVTPSSRYRIIIIYRAQA